MDKYLKARFYENGFGRVYCWTEDHVNSQELLEKSRKEHGDKFRWVTPEMTFTFDSAYGPDKQLWIDKATRLAQGHGTNLEVLARALNASKGINELRDCFKDRVELLDYFSILPTKSEATMNPVAKVPNPAPHAELQVEYVRQKTYGELDAGWWLWEGLVICGSWKSIFGNVPRWHPECEYRYIMTDKHPKYVAPKPKLKLINMMALPKGSAVCASAIFLTSYEVRGPNGPHRLRLVSMHADLPASFDVSYLRVAEQKAFTYWGGGECPVPDGVRVECVQRRRYGQGDRAVCVEYINVDRKRATAHWPHDGTDTDIIAYRIIGAAPGWTDDPGLAE